MFNTDITRTIRIGLSLEFFKVLARAFVPELRVALVYRIYFSLSGYLHLNM